MGEKYIKKENGKEVIYERSFLGDTKVGEVRENFWGEKEINSPGFFGEKIGTIKDETFFSNEREATIKDEKGVFKKGWPDSNPTFRPKEKTYSSESSSYSSTSSSYAGTSGASSKSDSGSGGGLVALLLFLGLGVIAFKTCSLNRDRDDSQDLQQKVSANYQINVRDELERGEEITIPKGYTLYGSGGPGGKIERAMIAPASPKNSGETIGNQQQNLETICENVAIDKKMVNKLRIENNFPYSTSVAEIVSLKTPGGTPLYYNIVIINGQEVVTAWSPDKENWVGLDTLVVSNGRWAGEKPTNTNQNLIKKLLEAQGNFRVLLRETQKNPNYKLIRTSLETRKYNN